MNGAQALIETLLNSGIDTCFMNPGTSEMHFVASLDSSPKMKSVLCLFEGVATGAADGYYRVARKPAATLLHLGPGLSNGLANLHNAKRAFSAIVNIVGDHATYHHGFDAPLESDVKGLATPMSKFFKSSEITEDLCGDVASGITAAMSFPRGVATVVLPADLAWTDGAVPTVAEPAKAKVNPDDEILENVVQIIKSGEPTAMLLGNNALTKEGILMAAKICGATSIKLFAETFPPVIERGEGVVAIDRLSYLAEFAQMQLSGIKHLILLEAKTPVSFFAYPFISSSLTIPSDCEVVQFCDHTNDSIAALEILADRLDASNFNIDTSAESRPEDTSSISGSLDAKKLAQIVGDLLPENCIVSDESNTAGIYLSKATENSPIHRWMCLTGGSIGQGMPLATGAAIAARGQKVINIQADGSAMYTIQSLWTQSRENLDIVTIILDNQRYAVLEMELARVGAVNEGKIASSMLDISNPSIDFVSIAKGFDIEAFRTETAEEFRNAFGKCLSIKGPTLIHAILPVGLAI
jgi:acetolactate synthase-1/2/3 large subunit